VHSVAPNHAGLAHCASAATALVECREICSVNESFRRRRRRGASTGATRISVGRKKKRTCSVACRWASVNAGKPHPKDELSRSAGASRDQTITGGVAHEHGQAPCAKFVRGSERVDAALTYVIRCHGLESVLNSTPRALQVHCAESAFAVVPESRTTTGVKNNQ